jgi:hypothetical protein
MQNNSATVSQIHKAILAVDTALDKASSDRTYRLQMGILLQGQSGLSLSVLKDSLQHFSSAIAQLDPQMQASLTMDLAGEDLELAAVFKEAQEAIAVVPEEAQNGVEASKAS